MKISLFDKSILKKFSIIVAFLSSIIGIVAISIDIDDKYKWIWFVSWVVILLIIYICLWIRANKKKESNFYINGTNVKVYVGDIFNEKDGLKVIPMNEYFDTQADDVVVSKISLHGQFLINHCDDINEFDNLVKKKLRVSSIDENRKVVNHKNRYELGSIVKYNDFLLTAFTKFDEHNKAYLLGKDYLYFWGSFWMNLDEIFAGRTVYLPLFGSGITRFKDYSPTVQEMLENILYTMRKTGFRNKYPDKSINILIYEGNAKDIDFYHLKEKFGD